MEIGIDEQTNCVNSIERTVVMDRVVISDSHHCDGWYALRFDVECSANGVHYLGKVTLSWAWCGIGYGLSFQLRMKGFLRCLPPPLWDQVWVQLSLEIERIPIEMERI